MRTATPRAGGHPSRFTRRREAAKVVRARRAAETRQPSTATATPSIVIPAKAGIPLPLPKPQPQQDPRPRGHNRRASAPPREQTLIPFALSRLRAGRVGAAA